jgi:6-phospho-3-hexuloisomerase
MTTPPIGAGDLLIVSAGGGYLATIKALMDVARKAGPARGRLPSSAPGAEFTLFEVIVLNLRDRLGISPEATRANHTNLE